MKTISESEEEKKDPSRQVLNPWPKDEEEVKKIMKGTEAWLDEVQNSMPISFAAAGLSREIHIANKLLIQLRKELRERFGLTFQVH